MTRTPACLGGAGAFAKMAAKVTSLITGITPAGDLITETGGHAGDAGGRPAGALGRDQLHDGLRFVIR